MNDKIKSQHAGHEALSFHCIIHQESLCKSVLNFKHVSDIIVAVVNLIKSRGLNHRQFKTLLNDLECEHSDVLYHNNVRWLSMGLVLNRVWNLRDEIVLFLEMKNITCEFLRVVKDSEWLCDFAYAADMFDKLSEVNVTLQGKGLFAHDLYVAVKSFEAKLALLSMQLKGNNLTHFLHLQTQTVTQALADKYSQQTSSLKEEFARRFIEFRSLEEQFNLLTCPFNANPETATDEPQLELIDLQSDNTLKELFRNSTLIEFYSALNICKFGKIKNFASRLFSFFGSTYICEQTFSCLNINKSKTRSQLTDVNLQSVLRISTSKLNPDYGKLVGNLSQLHGSH